MCGALGAEEPQDLGRPQRRVVGCCSATHLVPLPHCSTGIKIQHSSMSRDIHASLHHLMPNSNRCIMAQDHTCNRKSCGDTPVVYAGGKAAPKVGKLAERSIGWTAGSLCMGHGFHILLDVNQ